MPTSRVTDILRAKHAAFFIAALVASLAMESRSAELIPPKQDLYFSDNAGVVSKEAAYRFNHEFARFAPPSSNRLRGRIDSSRDSAFVGAILKVRLDDREPGQPVAEENRGGGASETSTRRTTVTVTSTAAEREEHESVTPRGTTPATTGAGKPTHDNHSGARTRLWFLIIFVIAALIVIWRILRPGRSEKSPRHSDKSYELPSYPLHIAIKLKNGGGKPPQELDGWQASFEGTAKMLAPLRLMPLFEPRNSNRLNQLIARARRNDPDYKPPDFSVWFEVETPTGINADELVKPLRKLGNVETAYVMRVNPPPTTPGDDPHDKRQGYQDAAPKGVDARYAWGFLGGDGAGTGFVDLEHGWNLNHRDLKDAKITIISGINKLWFYHGTSVLGEVLMVDNTIGGVGIAPSAKGRVISLWRTMLDPKTYDAIHDAAANMSFGDVLLLEVQETNPVSNSDFWPAEILELNYEQIRLATAAGIVVVQAAGNGNHDLDRYINHSGKKIFNRNSADFLDSGAIVVGAGSSVPPHRRLSSSNHGNRVDCYAWGENIVTTTTSYTGKSNTEYTAHFGETSGAAAIVAGVALIVQGIAQAALGRRFSPRELRDLLSLTANGTPSATPATDRIGVMPDLRKIITNNRLDLAPIA